MNESNPDNPQASPRAFQQKIYQTLDEKLKSTAWNSGASEAHGALTGLACRGINSEQIQNKMVLFQISDTEEFAALSGLFDLVLRDLESTEFSFNLLLPGEDASNNETATEIVNWCEGFVLGFCHDGESAIAQSSATVQEMVNDVLNISSMEVDSIKNKDHEDEKSIIEIEEFLRVGVQLIYDELVNNSSLPTAVPSAEIH